MNRRGLIPRALQGLVLLGVLSAILVAQASPAPTAQTGGVMDAGSTRYSVGVNGHRNTAGGPRAARALGATLARVEWGIDASPAELQPVVAAYARAGVRVQPLAGFAGRLPSTGEAQNLRAWALRFGPRGSYWRTAATRRLAVTHIEFGNETSYGYQYGDDVDSDSYAERARTYATLAVEAARALQGTGVGLLVQADDGGTRRSTWVDQMLDAAPELPSYAAGWIVHPYGPSGSARIRSTIAYLGQRGVPVPSIRIFVTEWGLASANGKMLDDNYGYPRNMTYDAAARVLRSTIAGWRSRYGPNLAQVILYQDYASHAPADSTDREHYFGLLQANGSVKGSYTVEARRLLAGTGTPR